MPIFAENAGHFWPYQEVRQITKDATYCGREILNMSIIL